MAQMKDDLTSLAAGTGVFAEHEIAVLGEVLDTCVNDPASGYVLMEEGDPGAPSGFAVFGKTPCTVKAWDIYWLAVSSEDHGKGIAAKLLSRIERHTIDIDGEPVLRVETSSRKEYGRARGFYLKHGFTQAGCVPDFYSKGDDLMIYYKKPVAAT
jgi:ribosomal protein S18 acetylase RimI-like enzyme